MYSSWESNDYGSNFEKETDITNKKKVIIIDRFIYSTLAYQFYGMNLSLDIINKLNKYIIGNIKPLPKPSRIEPIIVNITKIKNFDHEYLFTKLL